MELCADSGLRGKSPGAGVNTNFRSGSMISESLWEERSAFRRMKKKSAATKTRNAMRTLTTMPAIAPAARDFDFEEAGVGVSAGVPVMATSLGEVRPVGGGVG